MPHVAISLKGLLTRPLRKFRLRTGSPKAPSKEDGADRSPHNVSSFAMSMFGEGLSEDKFTEDEKQWNGDFCSMLMLQRRIRGIIPVMSTLNFILSRKPTLLNFFEIRKPFMRFIRGCNGIGENGRLGTSGDYIHTSCIRWGVLFVRTIIVIWFACASFSESSALSAFQSRMLRHTVCVRAISDLNLLATRRQTNGTQET